MVFFFEIQAGFYQRNELPQPFKPILFLIPFICPGEIWKLVSMPESRDRLVRTVDVAAEYARRRLGLGSSLFDRHLPQAQPVSEGTAAITIWRDKSVRTRRNSYSRLGGRNNLRWMRMPSVTARGTPATTRSSRSSSSRGRGVNHLLPSWYPRTPLQDITTVARAYDRKRVLLRLTEGLKDGGDPITQGSPGPASSAAAPIKHNASVFMTPCPSGTACPNNQSIGKILLNIVNKKSGVELEFLTPQRKLLNEIDTVREVALEEIRQFNETPLVKKAEQERKVCVLMSMR